MNSIWHQLDQARTDLSDGKLCAIPTETVYGLAARFDHPEAILKIFEVKERPFFDPLILHIGRLQQIEELTEEFSELAEGLAKEFWPGPMTMVLKKSLKVDERITAGLETVGIRMPSHPLCLRLLRNLRSAVAAPSANRFGKTSPTRASHIREEFPDQNFFILDGGDSSLGIESTVLRPDKQKIQILRPGPIGETQLRAFLVKFELSHIEITTESSQHSPGHMKHHYQPAIPLVWSQRPVLSSSDLESIQRNLRVSNLRHKSLDLPRDAKLAARVLYSQLRELSQAPIDFIFFCPPLDAEGDWTAVYDRLSKASSLQI
ncbi:MAG: threonylcarbamoyl-AMP synthase [Bradymonadales bacterium]|nr:MAG: threonylcarbamoyl-AMP synthase [Bradymonadales bacterium]